MYKTAGEIWEDRVKEQHYYGEAALEKCPSRSPWSDKVHFMQLETSFSGWPLYPQRNFNSAFAPCFLKHSGCLRLWKLQLLFSLMSNQMNRETDICGGDNKFYNLKQGQTSAHSFWIPGSECTDHELNVKQEISATLEVLDKWFCSLVCSTGRDQA